MEAMVNGYPIVGGRKEELVEFGRIVWEIASKAPVPVNVTGLKGAIVRANLSMP